MSRWSEVALGDVLRERRQVPDLVVVELGGIPVVAKIVFETGQLEYREGRGTKTNMILVRPGDLLVSGINAYKGAIAYYGHENSGPVAATIHYSAYEVLRDRADPRYLWWLLRSAAFQASLAHSAPGGIKTELRAKRLLPMRVPLPPLSGQREIARKLDHVARSATCLERLGAECKRGIDALPLSWMSQRLVDFETRFHSVPLRNLITASGYGTSIRCTGDRGESAVPILRIPNVASGRVVPQPMKYAELTSRELAKVEIAEGDLLIVRTNGSRDLVGRCAVVEGPREPTGFASYLVRLVPNQASVEPEYLQAVLSVRRSQGALFDLARTTAGQYNISLGRLVSIAVPLPTLEEQRSCMHHLAALSGTAQRCSSTAHAASSLLPTIRASIERNALFP